MILADILKSNLQKEQKEPQMSKLITAYEHRELILNDPDGQPNKEEID